MIILSYEHESLANFREHHKPREPFAYCLLLHQLKLRDTIGELDLVKFIVWSFLMV